MPKMTLERFREIKNRIAEIKELIDRENNGEIEISAEESKQLNEELENMNAEIHSSDLSDIPYEEYQGFYDLDFNFEGTGANLDFEIIDSSLSSETARLKGCNVRNFNFDEQAYEEDSFDEEFIQEHEDKFLDRSIPAEVRQRYYERNLKLEDIVNYEFPDENISERIGSWKSRKFLDKVPLDVIKRTGIAELFSSYMLESTITNKIDEFEGEITEQVLENLMRESVEECLNSAYLSIDSYKEIISLQRAREFIPDELVIDFEDNDGLEIQWIDKLLTVENIVKNKEIFRGKRFIKNLHSFRNGHGESEYEGVTEERIYYIIDNYPEIADVLCAHPEFLDIAKQIDPELDKEENLPVIEEAVNKIIHAKDFNGREVYESMYRLEERKALERYYTLEQVAKNLDENTKYYFDIVMKYTTPEKIASLGLSLRDLEDRHLCYFFSKYGLETVMEFDKANGNVFSKDNFDLAKKIYDYYLHYAGNINSEEHTLFFRTNKPEYYDAPYTIEDFEENVRRMIVYGPLDRSDKEEQPIDYRNFSDSFKAKFPEMFLDESAPEELKNKFYTKTLTLDDIEENPEWADFLDGKDFEIGMKLPRLMSFTMGGNNQYISLYKILENLDSSKSNIFNFLFNNQKLIKILEMNYDKHAEIELEGIENLDELKTKIEDIVGEKILAGEFYYGEPYILDSFREKHPEIVLDDDAPKELKMKYYTQYYETGKKINLAYNQKLSITDLVNEEYYPFLVGKSFDISPRSNQVRGITSFFDIETIVTFCKNNPEGYKILYDLEKYNFDFFAIDQREMKNIKSLEELVPKFEELIEKQIMSGRFEYGEMTILDSFREKHPELVLSKDAPEELKAKFYSIYYNDEDKGIQNPFDNTVFRNNRAIGNTLTIADLANEEYYPFLKGKSFDLLRGSEQVKNITKIFDIETIADYYKMDPEAFEVYCLNVENANKLKEAINTYPEEYAREEMMQGLKLTGEEFDQKLASDDEFKAKFEALKRGYIEDFVHNPGFLLTLDPEKRSRETLRQYKSLSSSNMLHGSNRYERQSYEQILANMIGFLGYDEAKRLLDVPQVDEETLDKIYAHDEIIKSLYEKKFEIIGNLKILGKLFEGIPSLLPGGEKITSKPTLKLLQSLNTKIQNGYSGDITSLLTEILEENGVEIDSEKISELVKNVINVSTEQKLDLVRESNSVVIDTNILENQKTKNMIKIQYRNALEYSLNKSEKVDPKLVREYLEKEFARIRDDNGEPYYSSHVTEHLEELVRFAEDLSNDPEWSQKLNHTVVDNLKEESGKIGKGWIRKITKNVCFKPEKLTYEEIEMIEGFLYSEDSELEIDTKATIGLKKLSEEEKAKIYELLENEQFAGLFTYGKAENMFSAMKLPYSEKFREFFLAYRDEFINNPDLYTNFTAMASNFDRYLEEPGFNTRFKEGKLLPNDVMLRLSKDVYKNLTIGKGEHELFYQARVAGLEEDQVRIAQQLLKDMQKREYQTIPQEQAESKNKRFRGRIVRIDDPLHFTVGKITDCCQTIGVGQPGESSMIHSATERNGALFVVEELDENGESIGIVSQSWTWRNGNRVCFDNAEIPEETERTLRIVGGFDEIMEAYQESAKKMIETDRRKLRKLVEQGKITEEQYQAMVIKDVSMGTGCDDLIRNLSKEKRTEFPSLVPIVAPLEAGKLYTGANKDRVLYSDSRNSIVLISHNDEFAKDDHAHTQAEVGDYGVRYIKTRDIFRRRGLDIDPDKIESISKMIEKLDRESIFSYNPTNISEVLSNLGIYSMSDTELEKFGISMSESGDWYVLSEETENGIMIHESGVDETKPNGEVETIDRKMTLAEYNREIYKIMLDATKKGKVVTLDSYSKEKLFNLDSLIEEKIITIKDDVITVIDSKKLTQKVEAYNQELENQRRERLVTDPKEQDEGERE